MWNASLGLLWQGKCPATQMLSGRNVLTVGGFLVTFWKTSGPAELLRCSSKCLWIEENLFSFRGKSKRKNLQTHSVYFLKQPLVQSLFSYRVTRKYLFLKILILVQVYKNKAYLKFHTRVDVALGKEDPLDTEIINAPLGIIFASSTDCSHRILLTKYLSI